MKYFKIIALTVLCMGFVSVYAQQESKNLTEHDAGQTTVQKDRASLNPNESPAGQAGNQTMVVSNQSVDPGNSSKEKQINPDLNPGTPRTNAPEPERTVAPNYNKSAQQGSSPNDGPSQAEPIDK